MVGPPQIIQRNPSRTPRPHQEKKKRWAKHTTTVAMGSGLARGTLHSKGKPFQQLGRSNTLHLPTYPASKLFGLVKLENDTHGPSIGPSKMTQQRDFQMPPCSRSATVYVTDTIRPRPSWPSLLNIVLVANHRYYTKNKLTASSFRPRFPIIQ